MWRRRLDLRRSALLIGLVGLHVLVVGCIWCPPTDIDRELEKRRERIRAYFKARHDRLRIVATTVTESGQTLDWIWPASQISIGSIESPPDDTGDTTTPEDGRQEPNESAVGDVGTDQPTLTEVQIQPNARGPKGTVPIVRFDVEAYLDSVLIPPEDPEDVLRKLPPPTPESNDRYYVVWQRFGTFYGSTGRINIWNTAGPVNNETSIAQVAVIRGSPMQAIEAGKIEYQGLNGNLRPHFFTYFRTNGTASGDWVAGYNTLVDGWIQYSATVAPGMSLVPWESTENGAQYSLEVHVRLWQGNWWVKAAGEWAGYYPYYKKNDPDEGTLFSASGIRDQASRLDWYGEVYDSSAPSATSTDMGSGDFAEDWWQHAAYFRNLTYFWAPSTHWWWDSGSITATDSACYNVDGPHYSSDTAWRNWFFYGGPGDEAPMCN
jgi:hypothetical protein